MLNVSYDRNGDYLTVRDDHCTWSDVRIDGAPVRFVLSIGGKIVNAEYDPETDTWTTE